MNSRSIAFIANQGEENLGIGYMSAFLSGAGYEVSMIEVRKEKPEILKVLQELDPLLVGYSVIIENHIHNFQELIEYLRSNGISCHFTAGGHFASLQPGELLKIAPSLDSLVRFEGEHTILDLVNHLHQDKDWKKVKGISYLGKGKLVNNELRALEPDLDTFPIPHRPELKEYVLEKKYATLLAGRGCIHNCSFCDIREFYSPPPGPVKRIRKPEKVVEEMAFLYREHDCRVFLFQDDEFPLKTSRTSAWVEEFCQALKEQKLMGQVLWKINCRPDEVEEGLFALMKNHGLFKVYLGIEDGTQEGLKRLNKRLTVEDHIEAVRILKDLGITIDYGFMLFQPNSTFETVDENLTFLEGICQEGYMPVFFLKMLPYLGNRIEKELRDEGRLIGMPGLLDYYFYEQPMDDYYLFVSESLQSWIHDSKGVNRCLQRISDHLAVYGFFHGYHPKTDSMVNDFHKLVAGTNYLLLKTLRELLAQFRSGKYSMDNDSRLDRHRNSIKKKSDSLLKRASDLLDGIKNLYRNREILLDEYTSIGKSSQ